MNSIGGYFGLELNDFNTVYHDDLLMFNSGRSALEFIFKQFNYTKIYAPFYTCPVVFESLAKLNVQVEYYNINESLLPEICTEIEDGEGILINNYYGVLDSKIEDLVIKYGDKLIVDNSQAFFYKTKSKVNTFYSPRKFFGLPDGGFANCAKGLEDYSNLKRSSSYQFMNHLLKRIDLGAEEGYLDFKNSESNINLQGVKKMSRISISLLRNINFEKVKKNRNRNFKYLHKLLRHENELTPLLETNGFICPMIYPFLKRNNHEIKEYLIAKKIYIPSYWPELELGSTNQNKFEKHIIKNLLPLPIDQRMSLKDVEVVYKNINQYSRAR